jgi:hypothetical protein
MKHLWWVTRVCWAVLLVGIGAVGFFPGILVHLHFSHRGIVAFELFLLALFAVTIFVEVKERYASSQITK